MRRGAWNGEEVPEEAPSSDLPGGGPFPLPSPLPLSDLSHSSGVRLTHLSCSPPQAALQAAAQASVDIKNVLDFYKQWKEIG